MTDATGRGTHSAAASALGYFYQVRLALLEALRRLRTGADFVVSIETLDDVVFERLDALEVFQTKHHLKRSADLTDFSVDLWKTLRIWCEAFTAGKITKGAVLNLITTGAAATGEAASYLRNDAERNVETARTRLNSAADSCTNEKCKAGITAYKALGQDDRKTLLEIVFVSDSAHNIDDLDKQIIELLYFAVNQDFLIPFVQRLEGWWFRRSLIHLLEENPWPILREEISSEISVLREQFKQENLPIDDDIMRASVDASGYHERLFVEQLNLIQIGNQRIFHAIRNYFRAFEQRSRWIREDLLLVGELERYEDRLIEEWDVMFQQMNDELGSGATDEKMRDAAQTLYKWVETASHPCVRTGVVEPSIARGSYHILSDSQRVGWHAEFKNRLKTLLENRGGIK